MIRNLICPVRDAKLLNAPSSSASSGCATDFWPCTADKSARCDESADDKTNKTSWAAVVVCEEEIDCG